MTRLNIGNSFTFWIFNFFKLNLYIRNITNILMSGSTNCMIISYVSKFLWFWFWAWRCCWYKQGIEARHEFPGYTLRPAVSMQTRKMWKIMVNFLKMRYPQDWYSLYIIYSKGQISSAEIHVPWILDVSCRLSWYNDTQSSVYLINYVHLDEFCGSK